MHKSQSTDGQKQSLNCVRHLKQKNIEDDDFITKTLCVADSIYVRFDILLPSNIQGIIILHQS
jgi:hypothetical protein